MMPEVGLVVKRYVGSLDREVTKATRLYEAGRRHGFVAPQVLRTAPSENTITYQMVRGIVPLRDLYLRYMSGGDDGQQCVATVRLAGATLAVLHRELPATDCIEWAPPPAFAKEARRRLGAGWSDRLVATPMAALHCDFGFGNIHLSRDEPSTLVLLDPSPNYYLTFDPLTVGSIYVDLATLMACLWGLVPVRHFVRLEWSRLRALDCALRDGYETVAGTRLDRDLLEATTSAVVTTYMAMRLGSGGAGRQVSRILTLLARRGIRGRT